MNWNAHVRTAFDATVVPDDDVIEELAQHAKATYDAARAEGQSHDAAMRHVDDLMTRWRANAPALRHRRRRIAAVAPPPLTSTSPTAGLSQDVRYAFRVLARQRRFALLVIATTALGIAAATLLISVSYGVLLRRLPWPNADRIVVLEERRGGRPPRFGAVSNAAYLTWTGRSEAIEQLAAWSQRTATLAGDGDPERIQITAATPSIFPALGITSTVGSLFDAGDDRSTVIVLSERLWRRRFSADRDVAGRLVRLDGQPYRVVGVIADRFGYPDSRTDAWVPFAVAPTTGNLLSMFNAIATLRPGVAPSQAATEGTARGQFVASTGLTTTAIFGGDGPVEITAVPLHERLTGDVRRPLVVLLVAVAMLLVTACANIAGLQLARATARRREFAIRTAMGAGGWRLTRQLLIEHLVLGVAGGVAGVVVAWWVHRSVPSLLPADFPRIEDVQLDGAVGAVGVFLSLATSLLIGWLPARRARVDDVAVSLADDGRAPVGVGARSPVARTRVLVMSLQVAITCVLLVGASLLGRTFYNLVTVDRGYDPSGVYAARVNLPAAMYSPARRHDVVTQIVARLKDLPEIAAAGFASELPLTPGGSTAAFVLRPASSGDAVSVQASPRLVDGRALLAMGLRLVEGRAFSDTDVESSEPVAMVNRTFARRFLGDRALGVMVPMGVGYENPTREAKIVGVIEDVRYVAGGDAPHPEIYYSYRQLGHRLPVPGVTLLVRPSPGAMSVVPTLHRVIRDVDPTLALGSVLTLDERMASLLSRPRLYAVVLGTFALCALIVAAVGLFAVLSYSVAQRSRELAVRSALGANASDLVRLVLRQGLTITGIGATVGLIVAAILMPALGTLLFGVTTHDGATYIAVPLLVLLVAAVASLAPAWRAGRVSAVSVLKS